METIDKITAKVTADMKATLARERAGLRLPVGDTTVAKRQERIKIAEGWLGVPKQDRVVISSQ